MKMRVKWMLGVAVVAAMLLQLTNPARTNPPVVPAHDMLATNAPPPELAARLRAACYDCHSDETKWPWYSHVAPISWWVVGHVKDARQRLNFSEWPHDDPQRARKNWNRISDEAQSGDMPLPSYVWMHASARLSPQERERLAQWAEQEAQRLESATAQ